MFLRLALLLAVAVAAGQKPQSALTCPSYPNRNTNDNFSGQSNNVTRLVLQPFIFATPRAVPALAPFGGSAPAPVDPWAKPWAQQSCCSEAYSNELQTSLANLYTNWSYDYCGTMSKSCKAYLYAEEAFYNCDPFAAQYANTSDPYGTAAGVPLCAGYCEDWFNACADDLTCATSWSGGFPYDPETYAYGCAATNYNPENTSQPPQCTTFRSRFTGGKDLCNHMWGAAFTYSTDASTCLAPYFYTGINPNAAALGYGASNTPTPTATPAFPALTQNQALAIGLGVGLGVPALLIAVGVATYFLGVAAGSASSAARRNNPPGFELATKRPGSFSAAQPPPPPMQVPPPPPFGEQAAAAPRV